MNDIVKMYERESTKPKVNSVKRLIKLINCWQGQSQRQKVQCSNIRNEKDFQRIMKGFNELLNLPLNLTTQLKWINSYLSKNNLPK